MNEQYFLYTLGFTIAFLISSYLILYGIKKRSHCLHNYFILSMFSIALWSFCSLMEFISPQISSKIIWAKLSYVGITTIAPFLFLFILSYINGEKKINPYYASFLIIIPLIVTFLALINEWDGLIWKSIALVPFSGFYIAIYEHGPALWINIIYSYSLLFLGILLLTYTFINSPKIYRLQTSIVLMAIAFPFIFNIIYLSDLSNNPVDLTPIAFSITGALAAFGIFKFQLLDILPVAYNKLFKTMENGFLIVDMNDQLLEINVAAQKMFNIDSNRIGKNFSHIFGKWNEFETFYNNKYLDKSEILLNNPHRWVEVNKTPLYGTKNDLYGRLIIITDINQRKNSENALKEKERALETLISNLPGVAYRCRNDHNWTMEFVSEGCLELTGYPREDIISNKLSYNDIIHPDDRKHVWDNIQEALKNKEPFKIIYKINTKDSKLKYVWEQGRGIFTENGDLLALEGFITDITDRTQAEEEIKKTLEEKNILFQEIHHRVKNNMQIISSLLSLQSSYIKDDKTLNILKESQMRIRAMALVHEKLYQSESLGNINFADYIQNILSEIEGSYFTSALVKTKTNIEDVYLDINTAIPCGLIINELISNVLKHAFKNRKEGHIKLDFSKKGENFELVVQDDGIGLPPEIDLINSNTLGLQLVGALVDQLNGTINISRKNGTQFTIKFKNNI